MAFPLNPGIRYSPSRESEATSLSPIRFPRLRAVRPRFLLPATDRHFGVQACTFRVLAIGDREGVPLFQIRFWVRRDVAR